MIEINYRKTVAIFGGTGFIGEEIVQHLSKNNYRIKIATRNTYLAQNLKVFGDIAQIELHTKSNLCIYPISIFIIRFNP